MLNKEGTRELAYVVAIDAIEPIVGSDNCEAAVVGGWKIMTRKGTFKPGDLAIYFEIDSKLPARPEFEFLANKHYKVKTQRYTFGGKGNFISQGLLMTFAEANRVAVDYQVGDFLTKDLGVTYAEAEDNKRKAKSDPNAKYKSMMSRHPKLARSNFGKWAMRHLFMKKVLYFFLGRKSDKKKEWPLWVTKTDEERIQNLTHLIPEFVKEEWIATEKVDGTSTTFTAKRKGNKSIYYVCSRNVVMNQPGKEKTCFYAETDGNVYVEMSKKYHMQEVLNDILKNNSNLSFVTVQGETYGGTIQKRDYSIKDHDLVVFNVIYGYKDGTVKRYNPFEMKEIMDSYGIPCVPIIGRVWFSTYDEIMNMAHGESKIDKLPREGLVFRTLDGVRSFKAVDNEFLLTYHK